MNWERSNFLKPHRQIGTHHYVIYVSMWLILFFSGIGLHAATLEEGNTYLKNGQYDEAITTYESIIQEGFIGYELFFNLGTAYSKKGDLPNAILNFEKAGRIKPTDPLIRQQLVLLNLKLRDKPAIYDNTGILAIITKVQFALSIDAWAFLSIFLMLLVPLVIYVSYKFKNMKGRKLIFLSSIFWVLTSGFAVVMARNCYHHKYLHEEAIIFPESIPVTDQPDKNSTILFNLHQGTKVDIVDSTTTMYYVEYSDKKGWISNKDVKKVQL